MLLFDVKTIKTTQNYKRDQITINLHRFDVKTIKNIEVRSHSKHINIQNKSKTLRYGRKTTKLIKLKCIASIWRQNDLKSWDTSLNYDLTSKSNQITMDCIDLTSKRSKTLRHRLRRSQNIQNNVKLQNWSNYNGLHRFDIKTIKNVEIRRKTFKTTQNFESDQITSNDKKCSVTSQNIENNTKLQNWSK